MTSVLPSWKVICRCGHTKGEHDSWPDVPGCNICPECKEFTTQERSDKMDEPNKPSAIYGNAIFVRAKKDVPQVDHWAILKFVRMSTPSYDAGGPPDSVTVVEWDAYIEQKDVEAAVQKLETEKFRSCDYVVVRVSKPAAINHKVSLT